MVTTRIGDSLHKRRMVYLYNELIKRGKSRASALIDVAMAAMQDYGSELSDEAANIITSEKYLMMS